MIEIRRLLSSDERSAFRSGNPDLDRFFHQFAGQNQFRHHIGTTCVAVEGPKVLGYATVSASHLEIEGLPPSARRKLPRDPLPVLRLARLAVDVSAQGRGAGKLLLRFVFGLAHELAEKVGCIGVVADAKPGAQAFYEGFGFEALPVVEGALATRPEPTPVFLPLGRIPKK